MQEKGLWLTILDYAKFKETSISTIRRYIKANRIKWKKEKGKYLIFVPHERSINSQTNDEKLILELRLEISRLNERVKQLEEENADFKMLVKIYEEKKQSLPDLPVENTQ